MWCCLQIITCLLHYVRMNFTYDPEGQNLSSIAFQAPNKVHLRNVVVIIRIYSIVDRLLEIAQLEIHFSTICVLWGLKIFIGWLRRIQLHMKILTNSTTWTGNVLFIIYKTIVSLSTDSFVFELSIKHSQVGFVECNSFVLLLRYFTFKK